MFLGSVFWVMVLLDYSWPSAEFTLVILGIYVAIIKFLAHSIIGSKETQILHLGAYQQTLADNPDDHMVKQLRINYATLRP